MDISSGCRFFHPLTRHQLLAVPLSVLQHQLAELCHVFGAQSTAQCPPSELPSELLVPARILNPKRIEKPRLQDSPTRFGRSLSSRLPRGHRCPSCCRGNAFRARKGRAEREIISPTVAADTCFWLDRLAAGHREQITHFAALSDYRNGAAGASAGKNFNARSSRPNLWLSIASPTAVDVKLLLTECQNVSLLRNCWASTNPRL